MLAAKPHDRPTIVEILNKPYIKARAERYMNDLLNRSVAANDMDDIYLDTLREQAVMLSISIGGNQTATAEEEGIKKYPSSKDFEKKQISTNKSYMTRRSEDEDNELIKEYHSKRKSTFEKESHTTDKSLKKGEETSTSSFKALNVQYDIYDEK
jgi:hypothetical protein